MTTPIVFFREAVRAVPAIRYALGIGGIVSVIAILFSFRVSGLVATLGTVIMLVLMMMLVIFARASSLGPAIRLPALVFTWFALLLFMATSIALFGSVFFKVPLDLTRFVTGELASAPHAVRQIAPQPIAVHANPRERDRELLRHVALGIDLSFLAGKFGTPASQGESGGFIYQAYSFDDYDLTVIFDREKKVLQYEVFLRTDNFHPEVHELTAVLNRSYYLGVETFSEVELGIFSPTLISPIASDAEPFEYYEILQETPATDIAIRLAYVVPRSKLQLTSDVSAETLESVSDAIHDMGCQYSLPIEGTASFHAVQARSLDSWRRKVRPNGFAVQRRLEDTEVKPFNDAELAAERLCEVSDV